jgi:hypothetical protein
MCNWTFNNKCRLIITIEDIIFKISSISCNLCIEHKKLVSKFSFRQSGNNLESNFANMAIC